MDVFVLTVDEMTMSNVKGVACSDEHRELSPTQLHRAF